MSVRVRKGGFMLTCICVRILIPLSYLKLRSCIYIYISSIRPVVSVPSSPSSSSVRPSVPSSVPSSSFLCPSVPSCLVVAVVVLCPSVCPLSVRPRLSVVVVRPLYVRPVVRLIIASKMSRSIRRMGKYRSCANGAAN